jgi:hypothetical protein
VSFVRGILLHFKETHSSEVRDMVMMMVWGDIRCFAGYTNPIS